MIRDLIYAWDSKKTLKKSKKVIKKVHSLVKKYDKMSDEEIKNEYLKIKEEIKSINKDYTQHRMYLSELLAMIKVASKKTMNMDPYDVQLIGAMVLDEGKIAEMKTGEGKTLTASIAAILNSVYEKPIHIVTVNDYLAKRDAEIMKPLYNFFGLDTGVIYSNQPEFEKQEMYQKEIVYATNSELGFDYLRDNLVNDKNQKVFKGERFYCIIDEVDSILIDEARTPLIISNKEMTEEDKEMYIKANELAQKMKKDIDYEVDEKNRNILLTEEGLSKAEEAFGTDNLYNSKEGVLFIHRVNNAIYAKELLKKDKHYTIRFNPEEGREEVVLIDEFTGRLAIGKTLSDGLHQAIEAKESLEITPENKTVAKITYPNFFSLYKKVAGMTGTAYSQKDEFLDVYGLKVVQIPTNRPVIRKDNEDYIYATSRLRDQKVVEKIEELYKKGQPVLVGTTNVDVSERISKMLKEKGIPHEVLNAKNHEREAEIIAKAGRKGAVTISTNMAGRGTDIKLDEEAKKLEGLYVIGVERNENRRIDDQLIGRSGRQGDPGESRFYLSLEDNLLRIFGGKTIEKIYNSMKNETKPLESSILTKAIHKAQKNIEGMYSEMRKNLLKYDNILDRQRKAYYRIRDEILDIEDEKIFFDKVKRYLNEVEMEDKKKEKVKKVLKFLENEDRINKTQFFRDIFLRVTDEEFLSFLNSVETLREGIHFRSFSQRDPLTEYNRESFILFQNFIQESKKRILEEISEVDIEEVKKFIEEQMNNVTAQSFGPEALIGKHIDEIMQPLEKEDVKESNESLKLPENFKGISFEY